MTQTFLVYCPSTGNSAKPEALYSGSLRRLYAEEAGYAYHHQYV